MLALELILAGMFGLALGAFATYLTFFKQEDCFQEKNSSRMDTIQNIFTDKEMALFLFNVQADTYEVNNKYPTSVKGWKEYLNGKN